MKQTIIITIRPHDVMASIEGQPEIWGCGKNYIEAIGELLWSHQDHFGIFVRIDDPNEVTG